MKHQKLAAALLLAAAAGAAQADAQSSVSISQVVVTVRDLTPSDGVVAAATWGSWSSFNASFSPSTQTSWTSSPNSWGGTDLMAGWAGAPVLSSSVSGTDTSYSFVVQGGLGQATAQLAADGSLSLLHLETTAASGQRLNGSLFLSQTLSVTAGTEVTVSMVLSGRVAVAAAAELMPPSTGGYSFPANGVARIQAEQFSTGTGASFSTYAQNYMFSGLSGAHSHEPAGVVLLASFSTPATSGNSYSFGIALNTETSEINTAIPEPGTWALMALGLLAVAGAARRRGR